jgi:hypothetical protein
VGVFNGCFYTDPTTQKPTFSNYYPGGVTASDITAFVVDDPDAVFLMDADDTFARADLFQTIQLQTQQGILKLESQKLNLMLELLELTYHS